ADLVANTNGTGASAPTFTGSSNDLVRSGGAALGAAVVSTDDPMLAALADNGGPTRTPAPAAPSTAAPGPAAPRTRTTAHQPRGGTPDLGAFQRTGNTAAVTSATSATFTVGTASTFTVIAATGFPAPPSLTESDALPTGVSFHDNGNGTAKLFGTPAAGQGGL